MSGAATTPWTSSVTSPVFPRRPAGTFASGSPCRLSGAPGEQRIELPPVWARGQEIGALGSQSAELGQLIADRTPVPSPRVDPRQQQVLPPVVRIPGDRIFRRAPRTGEIAGRLERERPGRIR